MHIVCWELMLLQMMLGNAIMFSGDIYIYLKIKLGQSGKKKGWGVVRIL
jgi:hypothetical protein